MTIPVLVDHPYPLLRQAADKPVGLDRIVKPGSYPPFFQAAFNNSLVDLLPVRIEKRQLAPRLVAAKSKIF